MVKRQIGILQILGSGVCFGTLGVLGKNAFQLGLSPGEFLCLRYLFAALLLGFYLCKRPRDFYLPKRTLLHCVALGVGAYAVFSSFFFIALAGLSASLTVLLLYTYPVLVSLGAWIFLSEKLSRAQWLALPVVMIGLVLLLWGEFQIFAAQAIGFGLLSALFYSLYILASSRLLKDVPPLSAAFYIMLSAGIALGILHFRAHTWALLPSALPVVSVTALIGTLMAMSLFLAGLQKVRNADAAVLSTAEPVTGVILASLLLGESFKPLQWMGALLVLASMVWVGLTTKVENPRT